MKKQNKFNLINNHLPMNCFNVEKKQKEFNLINNHLLPTWCDVDLNKEIKGILFGK